MSQVLQYISEKYIRYTVLYTSYGKQPPEKKGRSVTTDKAGAPCNFYRNDLNGSSTVVTICRNCRQCGRV